MSDVETAIREQFPRLRALWPALQAKPEHLSEIGRAIMQHEARLTAEDVAHGFDAVLAQTPTSAYPPGPHEVVGCILAASSDRRRRERDELRRARRETMDVPAREVVIGRACRCGGELSLLTDERALWCDECRSVQVVGGTMSAPRFTLDYDEIEQVTTMRTGPPPGGPEIARAFIAGDEEEDRW